MEKFYQWLAFKLPKKLVYHCVVRMWADVSTKSFRGVATSSITISDALKEYDIK